jgi:hypothetical protein
MPDAAAQVSQEAEGLKIGLLRAARSPPCLSRYEGQALVCFGLGNEEPSEYLKFEHHNCPALIFYKPIVRAFSRIGDKFNLTRLPMQKYTIALSDFLTLMNKRMASRSTLFLVFKGTSLSLIGPWERPPFPSTRSDPRPPPNRADPIRGLATQR